MTQVYLYSDQGRGQKCVVPGTRVCLSCPLHPAVCETAAEREGDLRKHVNAPECLLDYAIWKLSPYLTPSDARAIGDAVAKSTTEKGLSAAAFRRAVEAWVSRAEFLAALEVAA